MRPNADIAGVDQAVEDRYRDNLSDLGSFPTLVGASENFQATLQSLVPGKSVDRILKLYDSSKGTPKYFAILTTIRNKIIGNADAALKSHNTPLNWNCITKCLTLHYADKRDLTTLEYQMTTLVQGNSKVHDF